MVFSEAENGYSKVETLRRGTVDSSEVHPGNPRGDVSVPNRKTM